MIHVRGITVLNTTRFVRERFGPEAHTRVVESLPTRHRATFLTMVREASWKPIEDVLAYMEVAKGLLAPDVPGFHREIGLYSGQITGRGGFRFFIGSSPLKAVGRAAFMWRFLYDAGRVEVVSKAPGEITLRILDFPVPSRIWCERITGFIEAVAHLAGAERSRVEETACIHAGSDYCELRGTWE